MSNNVVCFTTERQKRQPEIHEEIEDIVTFTTESGDCLLYTSPSPRDATLSRMPSSA